MDLGSTRRTFATMPSMDFREETICFSLLEIAATVSPKRSSGISTSTSKVSLLPTRSTTIW